MVAEGPETPLPLHNTWTKRKGAKFARILGFRRHRNRSRPQPTRQQPLRASGAGKVGVGEDHPVFVLPRVGAHSTPGLVLKHRILLHTFGPFPGLVRRHLHPLRLILVQVGINHHPATLIAGIRQAPAGTIGCPPQPALTNPRVPMGARRDGLGQLDLLVGSVGQLKMKARALIAANHRKVACRKGNSRANGNRSHRRGGRESGRESKNRGKEEWKTQDMPFPSTASQSMIPAGLTREPGSWPIEIREFQSTSASLPLFV